MSKTIAYKEFETELLHAAGYSPRTIMHLFGAIKQMGKDRRRDFIRWFFTGKYPEINIGGFTVEKLVNQYGYRPIPAFLLMDWLETDFPAAKYFLSSCPSSMHISEKNLRDAEAFLKKHNINADEEEQLVDLEHDIQE